MNIYATWVKRLRSGRIEYGQMLQLKNVVWPLAHGGERRGHRTTLDRAEARGLVSIFERHKPYVLVGTYLGHGEWNQAGRNWIEANGRRAGFPPELVEHAQTIAFALVGFHCYQDDPPYREDWGRQQAYSPIYSASIVDGDTPRAWTYTPTAWQSGKSDYNIKEVTDG